MSLTTDIIGERVRDANHMQRMNAPHKRHMLQRAVATIEDLREAAGIPKGPGHDTLADIKTIASPAEQGLAGDAELRETFLQAAGMIRDLHIVLDSGTKVSLV